MNIMKSRCLGTRLSGALLALVVNAMLTARGADATPAVVQSSFIDPSPLYACSHASTIAETPEGLVAAWVGGSQERGPDMSIWLARNAGNGWSPAEEIANGIYAKANVRYPCWNPVLFLRRNGQLLLFYKVGPSPEDWWGMVRMSPDHGKSWVKVKQLPTGYVGPVRNKPIELINSTLICGSSSEDKGWRVHVEWASDPFSFWWRTSPLNSAYTVQAIQPTLLQWGDWKFQMLCRTKSGRVFDSWSTNNANSWTPLRRNALPNPNSALDGVVLRDNRALVVYNHSAEDRNVLNLAVSNNGKVWQAAGVLESAPQGEFSYPAVIQAADNMVHVTYSWNRQRIKHMVLDPAKLQTVDMVEGRWP